MKFAIAMLLCLPAGLWGYQLIRAVTKGQFRRRGYPGWLDRDEHSGEFKFAFVCNLLCFVALLTTIVAILFFTPGR